MAERGYENREKAPRITLSLGSLVTAGAMNELYVVYDVGLPQTPGPPLKACQILDEEKDLIAWSGSMYPVQVLSVLKRTWPETRILNAFIKSYRLTEEDAQWAIDQIENRGPRVFTL